MQDLGFCRSRMLKTMQDQTKSHRGLDGACALWSNAANSASAAVSIALRRLLLALAAILCIAVGAPSAEAQITNGNFSSGSAGWTSVANGGSIAFTGGTATVTGRDAGGGAGSAIFTQTATTGTTLTFTLVSYTSTDTGAWDKPVFVLDGTTYSLNTNGTLGPTPTTSGTHVAGTIDNQVPASGVTFTVSLTAGSHTFGFGVYSADSQVGPGIATFDNVTTTAAPVLAVTPATNFTSTGNQGGPFTPSPASYTVTNSGGGTLNWSVTKPSWLNFSATSGSLGAGASTTITVSVNTADTAATTAGVSSGSISFTSNGGSASRTATLTVNDTTAPVLTVPANISVFTPSGSATATVSYTVTATDNVTPSITPVRTAGLASGSAFPIGITTVTHTATDAAGNVSTASFTVTVVDNVPPVFGTCPAIRLLPPSMPQVRPASWAAVTATDNSGATITRSARTHRARHSRSALRSA